MQLGFDSHFSQKLPELFYAVLIYFSFDVHIVQVWIGLEWIISSFGDIFGSVHIESEMGKPVGYL